MPPPIIQRTTTTKDALLDALGFQFGDQFTHKDSKTIVHKIHNPGELWGALQQQFKLGTERHYHTHELTTFEENSSIRFEHCTIEQMCPGITKEDMKRIHPLTRLFAKIFEFSDKDWGITLACALPSGSPFNKSPYAMILVLRANIPNVAPHEIDITFNCTTSLAEPRSLVMKKGYKPETHSCGTLKGTLNHGSRYSATVIDKDVFMDKLALFHHFKHPYCDFRCDFRWKRKIRTRPDLSGIVRVLEIPELALQVTEEMNMKDVKALQHSCRRFYRFFSDLASQRMKHLLRRVFVPTPIPTDDSITNPQTVLIADFCSILRQTGSVVGGSTPLAVLHPGPWAPSDLDIIVSEEGYEAMHAFITQIAHFRVDDQRTVENERFYPADNFEGGCFQFSYRHYLSSRKDAPGIDLCITHAVPHKENQPSLPAEFVLSYHSTTVMNFWNGYHIYCLWPSYTFNGLCLINTSTPTTRMEMALEKYEGRGWKGDIFIQDAYPETANIPLRIWHVPKPRWREALTLMGVDELNGAVGRIQIGG